jgi:hypothetical protein
MGGKRTLQMHAREASAARHYVKALARVHERRAMRFGDGVRRVYSQLEDDLGARPPTQERELAGLWDMDIARLRDFIHRKVQVDGEGDLNTAAAALVVYKHKGEKHNGGGFSALMGRLESLPDAKLNRVLPILREVYGTLAVDTHLLRYHKGRLATEEGPRLLRDGKYKFPFPNDDLYPRTWSPIDDLYPRKRAKEVKESPRAR